MKALGDAMGAAAGLHLASTRWQLYDTAGTTEDDTYAATGGYGYTIEMGPPGGELPRGRTRPRSSTSGRATTTTRSTTAACARRC